jgi:hypothetical protein
VTARRGFERVRTADRKTFALRVTAETDRFLYGIEVDDAGDEIVPAGADERLRVVEKTAIVWRKPLRYSKTYGTLEVENETNKGDLL